MKLLFKCIFDQIRSVKIKRPNKIKCLLFLYEGNPPITVFNRAFSTHYMQIRPTGWSFIFSLLLVSISC